jgi:hypothetical protein
MDRSTLILIHYFIWINRIEGIKLILRSMLL